MLYRYLAADREACHQIKNVLQIDEDVSAVSRIPTAGNTSPQLPTPAAAGDADTSSTWNGDGSSWQAWTRCPYPTYNANVFMLC